MKKKSIHIRPSARFPIRIPVLDTVFLHLDAMTLDLPRPTSHPGSAHRNAT